MMLKHPEEARRLNEGKKVTSYQGLWCAIASLSREGA